MLHLTLRQVEIFCAVAQSGSTVAAAQAVSLSQSATSASLQQLERALGSQLFERVGRQLVLNDAGRALLPQALVLLEQARAIEQAFVVQGCGLPVRLRLAASTTIGSYVLPPVLAGREGSRTRTAAHALSAYLLLTMIAPAIGAFPVPLMGMGMSPIIGSWLGVGCLALFARLNRAGDAAPSGFR